VERKKLLGGLEIHLLTWCEFGERDVLDGVEDVGDFSVEIADSEVSLVSSLQKVSVGGGDVPRGRGRLKHDLREGRIILLLRKRVTTIKRERELEENKKGGTDDSGGRVEALLRSTQSQKVEF
jgi:hypothetical protein